ncbi:MAG: MdtA/MuxA family multidrug efflux RND transporter periplasmic adaptor subunit [Acidobacteria bacterium]|nr:MdtA/MuxA family multidrug efflux RND transporter periplasmic adaptor subunit [Acidobacteriota bacterium]
MNTSVEAPSRASRLGQWIIGLILLVGGGTAVWYYGVGQPAPNQGGPGRFGGMRGNETPAVRVVEAETRSIAVSLRALGTVTPINTVVVRPRLDGELVRVAFSEGQRVSAGQVLAEIDPRPYQVALAQAEGQRAENEARITNARTDLASFQSLYERQLIPRQQLTAQESLVKQIEGTIQSNDAQINNARLQLSYTKVVAPISGRLGLRQVDVGNLVRSGDANGIVVITQMQPTSVLFTVPETELPAVLEAMRGKVAPPVEAWDRAETTRLATGTLRTIDNQIDTTTGTIRLRALFDNADEKLYPNQFVNINLKLATVRAATVVPAATIQRASFGTFVYVIKPDGKATIRKVTLGTSEGERVAITEGVESGEQVVLEGVDALQEGTTVEIVGTGPAPPPSTEIPVAQPRRGQGGPGGAPGATSGAGAGQQAPAQPATPAAGQGSGQAPAGAASGQPKAGRP